MAFRDCDINEAGILDVQSVSDMISAFKAPAADAVKLIAKMTWRSSRRNWTS